MNIQAHSGLFDGRVAHQLVCNPLRRHVVTAYLHDMVGTAQKVKF